MRLSDWIAKKLRIWLRNPWDSLMSQWKLCLIGPSHHSNTYRKDHHHQIWVWGSKKPQVGSVNERFPFHRFWWYNWIWKIFRWSSFCLGEFSQYTYNMTALKYTDAKWLSCKIATFFCFLQILRRFPQDVSCTIHTQLPGGTSATLPQRCRLNDWTPWRLKFRWI